MHIFLKFNFSGIAPCTVLQKFADSADNTAAGALIQTNTLSYCLFRIYLWVTNTV
jgi:hypothetical protein